MMMLSRRVVINGGAFTRSISGPSDISPIAAKATKLDQMLERSGVRKAVRSQMNPFGNQ
jgi:hypothetical protein